MGSIALGLLLAQVAGAAPLTLDDALSLAARRNAELLASRADAEAAAAEVQLSYEPVLPRLDLTSGFGRRFDGEREVDVLNPDPPPDFVRQTVPAEDTGAHDVTLSLGWRLFDGLGSWAGIAAAKSRASAARRQHDESALRVAFDVTRRFYEVLRQQRALEVLQETARLSTELVQRADALFEGGRGTRSDTYSARVNLGNDEIAVQAQRAELARARAELAVSLGLPSEAGLEVAAPPGIASAEWSPDVRAPPALPDLLAEARRSRPIVSALRLAGEAADHDIARARAAWWPTLGLQGSWQKQSTELTGTRGVLGDPTKEYVALAQVTLAWNLYAGGSTRAEIARTRAQALRAQALVEQAEQSTAAEVTIARERLAALLETVPTVRAIQGAAEQSLRFSREQLEAGRGSQLEVRDATLKLTQARLTWIGLAVDLAVARADLNRAVGGTL